MATSSVGKNHILDKLRHMELLAPASIVLVSIMKYGDSKPKIGYSAWSLFLGVFVSLVYTQGKILPFRKNEHSILVGNIIPLVFFLRVIGILKPQSIPFGQKVQGLYLPLVMTFVTLSSECGKFTLSSMAIIGFMLLDIFVSHLYYKYGRPSSPLNEDIEPTFLRGETSDAALGVGVGAGASVGGIRGGGVKDRSGVGLV